MISGAWTALHDSGRDAWQANKHPRLQPAWIGVLAHIPSEEWLIYWLAGKSVCQIAIRRAFPGRLLRKLQQDCAFFNASACS